MNTPSRLLTAGLLALALAAPAAAGETHAYRAARVWPGSGPAVADGVLVVRDGKVVAVGRRAEVAVPADAVVHDLGDAVLIPGLVVAETTLADKGKEDLHALTPHHRAADAFDPYADYAAALAGGVTTVQVSPGNKRLMPGLGAVVKLAGEDPARRTLRDDESLHVVLGTGFKNPPRVYEPPVGAVSVDKPLEPTRPQPAAGLGGAVATLRAVFQAGRDARGPKVTDPFLRAVAYSGTARTPVRVTAPDAADVQAALALANEFDLRLVLVDLNGVTPVRDRLADWKARVAGVVLNPGVRPGSLAEAAGDGKSRPPGEVARDLRAAGLKVALRPLNDADLKEMLFLAGLFTSHNSPADVLGMLTADAAALLGVADRVGTLAPGKDADFVVLSGEPFALHTRVRAVYVDGRLAHEAPAPGARKVIRAGRILTGTGEVIANGSILVEGRTVRGIGPDVSVPADAEVRRFERAVIVPGFLDLGNGLGVGGPLGEAVPLRTKLGDRLVAGDPEVAVARQGGVTTALLAPDSPQPGPVLAFKLGDRPRPLKDPVALRFAVRGNLTTTAAQVREALRAGKAYAESWTKYEADLADYEKKKKEYDAARPKTPPAAEAKPGDKKPEEKKEPPKGPPEPKPPEKPTVVDGLEPYRALFAGSIPALVEAKREDAIRLALAIFRDEFNVRTVLLGADDAHRLTDLLAARHVSVAVGPDLIHSVDRADVNLPLVLAVRGVPFGVQSRATTGARNLPVAVAFSVRHGLGAEDALRGLTGGPAAFLGLDGSVGSLAVGKDADLVVLSGPPFELSTRVLAVMIDGQWVYQDGE
jgi:imidazolonepropionase-like amidohydrolase